MYACQLQRRDEDLEEATLYLQHMRLEGNERHDLKYSIYEKELAIRSIVLLYNTRRKKNMLRKLVFKWLGPYWVFDAVRDKGTYMLKKLDGSQLANTFAGDRLKKFHPRQRFHLDHAPNLDYKELLNLDKFLLSNNDNDFSDVLNDLSDPWYN